MKKNVSLSLITPVYNEDEIIVNATIINIEVLKNAGLEYEIILVNDGSTDNSKKAIDTHLAILPQVEVFHKEKNEGMGSAIRKGISLSNKEYIICVPADSPLNKDSFNAFLNNINKADVMVSYRIKRKGYSPRMLLNSFVFHYLVTWLFNIHMRDYNWIHLYHRKIFDEGKILIESKGIFMLAEILIKAKRLGYTFIEFPVEQHERLTGLATAGKISAVIKTFKEIWLFRFK